MRTTTFLSSAILAAASLSLAAPTPAPAPVAKVPFVTGKPVIELSNEPVPITHPVPKTKNVIGSSSPAAAAANADVHARQAQKACFVVGTETLPKEVADVATSLAGKITCNAKVKTLSGVPDVSTASGVTFSSVDFSQSKTQTPLAFALDKFATDPTSLAKTDLQQFQDMLDVYTATEAGIRSVGGNVAALKIPKFFLAMQVSRIQTAQGNPPKGAGQQVDHLRDKVTKNAPKEDKALIDQVVKLATQTK
ncbi:hypothetical protein PG994_009676 [Apiospora phragmitis]|uniref:DUF7143 domain-containing protein n=1 Tax=Apiospora phragmitis TaxID=2905665 RepID=A0ABR1U6U4_9PEZI